MRVVQNIKRKDTKVTINLDINLGTNRPIYPFSFNCNSQEDAELIKRQFEKLFEERDKYVALHSVNFLDVEEISELKMMLVNSWNAKDHCWK